jgi:hypothetical protein
MEAYQINHQWFVQSQGGHSNRDVIPAEERGPFPARPEPVAKWRRDTSDPYGSGRTIATLFASEGKPAFTLSDYHWSPAPGYSADISYETISDPVTPPTLGDAYRWTGQGWEWIDHPMAVSPY